MAFNPILDGQINFMLRGGPLEMAIQNLRKQGLLNDEYVYRQYPEMVRLSKGTDEKGKEIIVDVIVNSDEEKDRVMSGGMTSTQVEEERQGLLQRCRTMRISADPSWTTTRLRRELGDALDAPAPVDNMAKLEAELGKLKKMAEMQAEIEALRAQLATTPADVDEMRVELTTLGVKVDGRWSATRLREELNRATEPQGS